MAKITAPEKFTGLGVGGLEFTEGVAETDNEAIISYCRGAGYGIDGEPPAAPAADDRVDARDAETIVVGSALRDAAVDPRPDDFLPPTNAGQADPHGPLVVAPEIHASGSHVVRPGQVFTEDLAAQQDAETAQATALLVEGQDVGEATATFERADENGEGGSDTGPLGLSDPGSVVAVETGDVAELETPTNPDGAPAQDGSFDPAEHSVADVNDYLAAADDAERTRVLTAETDGKGRKGIVEGPHATDAV